MLKNNHRFQFAGFILIPIAIAGCTNLEAVRKFSKFAEQSSGALPAIANDVQASCLRRMIYEVDQVTCDRHEKAKEAIAVVSPVLTAYLNALGALAADELVLLDQDLTNLGAKLVATGRLDESQISATTGLAKSVARAVAGAYQQSTIRALVRDSNHSLQLVTKALRTIVHDDYGATIDKEEAALIGRYKTELREHEIREPLTALLIRERLTERLAELAVRRSAQVAANTALTNISEGHQALYDGREDLSSEELAKKLGTLAFELREQINLVADAF